MIQALSLIFAPLAFFFVAESEIFGRLNDMTLVTSVGVAIFTIFACIYFFFGYVPKISLQVESSLRLEVASLLSSLFLVLFLIYVTFRFGYSPVLCKLMGTQSTMLYGSYRAILPLKAVICPLAIINCFFSLVVLPWRWERLNIAAKICSAFAILAVAAIYETRYVLIWLVLYYFCHKFPMISDLWMTISLRKVALVLFAIFLSAQAFIFIGNIRTGINSASTANVKDFIVYNASLSGKYQDITLSEAWVIFYALSSFARGLDNGEHVEPLNFVIPKKALPGIMQGVPETLGLEAVRMDADTFARYHFAIDGYHTLCLNYGSILGVLIFILYLLGFMKITDCLNQRFKQKGNPFVFYALFLWVGQKVMVLPIGEYFLSFQSIIELGLVVLFMYIGRIRISSV